MSDLAPTVQVWFDGDDDPAEQLANFEGALDGLKADGLIRQYIVVEGDV